MKVQIRGHALGKRVCSPEADIIHVQEAIEGGPAENSFVLVCHTGRARYISWIGYFDIEYAIGREPGAWSIVEPSRPFEKDVVWLPYGWDGTAHVPTIGDLVLARH